MNDDYQADWISSTIMWFVFMFIWYGYVAPIKTLADVIVVTFCYFFTNLIHGIIMDFIEYDDSGHGGHTPTGHA